MLWCCLVFLAAPRATLADPFEDLEVHGFATQGYTNTSANRFFGDSEQGSFEFTELGVNATLQALPDIRLSGQLLSRRAGDMYSGAPRVDFALADLTVLSTALNSAGILIGRIKNPLGLFNETRDVAFTRPGVFLPQVIYFDKARNLIMSSDGAGIRMARYGDVANLSFYAAAGQTLMDENVEYAYLGAGYAGDFEPDGLSYIARVLVESPDERLRTALSIAKSSMDFERGTNDPIGSGGVDFVYGIASLQLSLEDWTLTTEYMREPVEWRGFAGSVFAGRQATVEGYFAQAAWQASEGIELMLRYEEGFADRADRSGEGIHATSGGLVPKHTQYSKILTMGVRWDITPDFMLRAEYQRHHGTFVLSSRENPDPGGMDPDWDLFALSVSYRF